MPISDYTPTLAQVGSLLRSRTAERGSGQEVGTFTDNTRPLASEVLNAITEAAGEVAGIIGADVPDAPGSDPNALRTAATGLVTLLTAMTIESSFYPDQIETGRSPYPALERRYNASLSRIAAAIEAAGGSVSPEDGAGGYGKPSFGFGDHDMTTMTEPR